MEVSNMAWVIFSRMALGSEKPQPTAQGVCCSGAKSSSLWEGVVPDYQYVFLDGDNTMLCGIFEGLYAPLTLGFVVTYESFWPIPNNTLWCWGIPRWRGRCLEGHRQPRRWPCICWSHCQPWSSDIIIHDGLCGTVEQETEDACGLQAVSLYYFFCASILSKSKAEIIQAKQYIQCFELKIKIKIKIH